MLILRTSSDGKQNQGVDYWIGLTTEVEGDDASATDHIVRIAIEDDFNAGADASSPSTAVVNSIQ